MKLLPISYKHFITFLKVYVNFSKIFGLAPFSVRITTEAMSPHRILAHGGPAFVDSKFGMIYNVLIITLLVGTRIYMSSGNLAVDYDAKDSITIAIWVFQEFQAFFTVVTVVGCCGFRQKTITSIMNRLLNTDVLLSSFLNKSYQEFSISYYFAHIFFTISTWCFYKYSELTFYGRSKILLRNISGMLVVIMYIFTVKYAIIVGSIARELKNFNEILSEFNESSDNELINPHNSAATGLDCSVSSITRRNNHVSDQLASLKLLHTIRNTLTEISKDVENYFSFPITHCILAFFLGIITYAYAVVSKFLTGTESSSFDYSFLKVASCYCIICYPMILLFENVRRTLNQANTTGHIVHTLLRRSNQRDIKRELEQFSSQLLHEKIKFTANGLFSLDFTLLHSMLGATTTYLVILIQFNTAGNEKISRPLSGVGRFGNENINTNDNNHTNSYIHNAT